ncbi:unnamed protein product [Prorocentrum cordatum]|uniref:Uncharacterized protein n=1 Tax=Prorocentrum cordatum TaxID=2364126 RepID=A0ABN9VEY3_9DINO|nr:unnamed protein product [Polarella glacialis]
MHGLHLGSPSGRDGARARAHGKGWGREEGGRGEEGGPRGTARLARSRAARGAPAGRARERRRPAPAARAGARRSRSRLRGRWEPHGAARGSAHQNSRANLPEMRRSSEKHRAGGSGPSSAYGGPRRASGPSRTRLGTKSRSTGKLSRALGPTHRHSWSGRMSGSSKGASANNLRPLQVCRDVRNNRGMTVGRLA